MDAADDRRPTKPPPDDDDDDDADDARTWGTDGDDDALADAFPPRPFPFASNADADALAHLDLLPRLTTDDGARTWGTDDDDALADAHLALPRATTDNDGGCDR